MEIFTNTKIDWLGNRWIFYTVSAVLALAGIVSLATRGVHLGIDFTGGTLAYVRFKQTPEPDRIRTALDKSGIRAEEVTRYGETAENQIQIRMARADEANQDLGQESNRLMQAFLKEFEPNLPADRFDLNNIARGALSGRLQQLDPEQNRAKMALTEFTSRYDQIAQTITEYRDSHGGVLKDWSQLPGAGVPGATVAALKNSAYLGNFTIVSVESVGPKVGQELQGRARNAVLFSLLGMLVYIAFRFRTIYGVAGVVALFHDVFITVGLFSLTGKEINLNVIAALLTLVGYSINDTIVVFDRVRENLKLVRRGDLGTIINLSINQTLNRTILTSGMTFLAVISLYLFGGEVLNGFAFALVVGIIIGTYSSIAIASPIVHWWQTRVEARKAAKAAA